MSKFKDFVVNLLVEALTDRQNKKLYNFAYNDKNNYRVGDFFGIEKDLYSLNKAAKELRDLKRLVNYGDQSQFVNSDDIFDSESLKLLKNMIKKYYQKEYVDNTFTKKQIIDILDNEKEFLYEIKNKILSNVPDDYIIEYSYFMADNTIRPLYKLWDLTFHGNPINNIKIDLPIYVIYDQISRQKIKKSRWNKNLLSIFEKGESLYGSEYEYTLTQKEAIKHQIQYLYNHNKKLLIKASVKYPDIIIPNLPKDESLYSEIINLDPETVIYFPENYTKKISPEIYLSFINSNKINLGSIPENLRTKEMYLKAVKNNGWSLRLVPEELLDKEICLTAVKQDGNILNFIPYELRDKEICLEAIKNNGHALYYVPKELKDKEICLAAVNQNGLVLSSVPYELKQNKEICLAAAKNNKNAFKFIPEELRKDIRQELGIRESIQENTTTRFKNFVDNILTEEKLLIEGNFKIKDMEQFASKMADDPTAPNYTTEQVTNKINKIYKDTGNLYLTRAIVKGYINGFFNYSEIESAIDTYRNITKNYIGYLDDELLYGKIVNPGFNWYEKYSSNSNIGKNLDKTKNKIVQDRQAEQDKKDAKQQELNKEIEDWNENAIPVYKYPDSSVLFYHPRLESFVKTDEYGEYLFNIPITKEKLDEFYDYMSEPFYVDLSDDYYPYREWVDYGAIDWESCQKIFKEKIIPIILEKFGNKEKYEPVLKALM